MANQETDTTNTTVAEDGTTLIPLSAGTIDKEKIADDNPVDKAYSTDTGDTGNVGVDNVAPPDKASLEQESTPPLVDDTSDKETTEGEQESSTEQPEETPLDMEKYINEVRTVGDLSAESISELATKLGTSEDVVKFTVAGMKAEVEKNTNEVLRVVGGKELYSEVTAWAAKSLPQADIDSYNKILTSGSPEAIIGAFMRLKAKFTEVNGSPKVQQNSLIPKSSVTSTQKQTIAVQKKTPPAFKTMEEQMKAQRDPRFGVDPKYTQRVYDMTLRSKY